MSQLQIHIPSEPSPLKRSWEFGVNTCHAPIVMRSDLQAQMKQVHQELGFRYWRAHGTLSDDVSIFTATPKGERQYTFSGLKRILDVVLESGMKPFLELSFMPRILCRDPEPRITHYKGHTSPPKDYSEWSKLISETIGFLLETYGRSELESWYFEIWNEPNIPFWSGTQREYFKLYAAAAHAIKRISPKLRVGGPATARAEWVGELLDYCREHRADIDFISTHVYPSDVAFVDSAEGDVELFGVDFLWKHFAAVRKEVDARIPGLSVFWGEWNSSAGPLAENHDNCGNAAVIAAALAGIEHWADGSLFWNLSDIYEECEYHFAPFHGGYGLLTVDDIPKSAFRSFEFFHRLESHAAEITGLPDSPEQGAFASTSENGKQASIILWNTASAQSSTWSPLLTVPPHFQTWTAETIKPGNGSAYETWIEMGLPPNLSRSQAIRLEKASHPLRETGTLETGERIYHVGPNSVVMLMFS